MFFKKVIQPIKEICDIMNKEFAYHIHEYKNSPAKQSMVQTLLEDRKNRLINEMVDKALTTVVYSLIILLVY